MSLTRRLALWTYTMASVTYLNIAVKVVYWLLFEDVFHGPELMTWAGFVYWTIVSVNVVLLLTRQLQCLSWAISFVSPRVACPAQFQVIGTAIPQVQTIQALVGAAFLLQFSYTFPPLMQLSFDVQADASKQDGLYRPDTGPNRVDNWSEWSRWRRGLFTGRIAFKSVNLIYLLASLATCALGIWGSVSSTSYSGLILRWRQSRLLLKPALRQALAVRLLYESAIELQD